MTKYSLYQSIINGKIPPDESKLPSIDLKDEKLQKINREMRNTELPILYRYTSISMNEMKNLTNESVYLVPAQWMNDTFEGAVFDQTHDGNTIERNNARMQTEVYLKCFSLKKNSILMWSHYADANKGICIGYDFSHVNTQIQAHLFPVQYSNTRFSCRNIENVKEHPYFYLRKSKDWKYEQECRLIYRHRDLPNGKQLLQLDCIAEVQFGLRMDPEVKESIRLIVEKKNQEEGKQIKLYDTIQRENSFMLKRVAYKPPKRR